MVGGRLTFDAAGRRRRRPDAARVGPARASSTPTATSASTPHGAVDDATAQAQAIADRDAGTLLIRDAGSPADTRWVDERDDLPKIIRAGRHIARTRRYIRNFAHEVEPDQLVDHVRLEAHAGDGWVKLVGDWIDRDAGDLAPCWPVDVLADAIAAAHEEGARVTAHCFGEESLYDFAAAGTDCIEHATRPRAATRSPRSPSRASPSCRPWSTSPPSPRSPSRPARSSPTTTAHMLDLHERRYATIAAAHDAGIPIYVGTDAGGSLRARAGRQRGGSPARRLSRPTRRSTAATLGRPRVARPPGLEEGEDADLVVYAADPRARSAPSPRPTHVVLRGRDLS